MQKLVLVAGFNPRVSSEGPQVLLAAGKWKLCAENVKDSILVLRSSLYEGTVQVKDGTIFMSEENNSFSLKIGKPGTEEYINVFAEMVN